MESAQKSSLLLDFEEDSKSETWSKHKKYYYSEKGRLRNQRRVDKRRYSRLMARIVDKVIQISELQEELKDLCLKSQKLN